MEVTNIEQAKIYQLTDKEKVPIIKKWLGREHLQLMETFTNAEKETSKTAEGLFVLNQKFEPCHNQIVLLPQY